MAIDSREPVHKIVDMYHRALRSQGSANSNFWANSAFIRGYQWIHFNPHTRRLEEVPKEEDRVQATINRLWPDSRTIISKLLQRELVFQVTPSSADDAAIEGSKVAEAILYAVKKEHRWEALRESVSWSTWKGGTAAVAVDWNPKKGKPTAIGTDGQGLPSGDTEETALSLAEFVIQPGAREAETAFWWIKAQALPTPQVKAMFNMKEDPPSDVTSGLSSLERGLMYANVSGQQAPGAVSQNTPLTLVLTYYERPNPSTPKGKVEVVVNNKTVQGPLEWPFPFRDYLNIATMRETVIENTWVGETVVTIARPVQAAFNAVWSNLIEHADVAGNARMRVPQSAIELSDQYTDRIGEQVPFMDGQEKPEWMSPPQLPAWLSQMPGELRQEIDDILGVHDVSRGEAPANIESGYGLAVLAEQDATPIGKLSNASADMWSRVASMVLKIYEAEVSETRTAVTAMPQQAPETTKWTGKTLAGQTEAEVPKELIAPRSRAAQAQFAEKALQMGLITTIDEMTRLAEAPNEREIIDAVRPDVARARRENANLAQGIVCIPENFDDHKIHIKEHNDFRKSARYERLPVEFKNLYADHIQAHATLAAEEAGAAAQRAQLGGPAMMSVPQPDGSQNTPMPGGMVPPPEQQTVMDQLQGSPDAAVQRQQAQTQAQGAATTEQNNARDGVLQLAQMSQGMLR